jgi:hypothetical protein
MLGRMRRRLHGWFLLAGTLSRHAVAGENRIAFSGRIGRRALRSGRYRAVFSSFADGQIGTTSSLRLTVVR